MNESAAPARRLFFALWPDAPTRARLAAVARRCSQHPVAAENLHMTLYFLGACGAAQERCYSNVVSRIKFEPFEINLNYIDFWARPQVRWLGARVVPPGLTALMEALGAALATCGYQPDKRDWVPHVTLSRKDKNPHCETDLPKLEWDVREFVLAESVRLDGDLRYRLRGRWPAGV